jgi:FkbM family methyltransferase
MGDTFVDVGANIGLMSIFSSIKIGKTGQVIAFEPNPATNKILKENIELNGIDNIKVESIALSDKSQMGKIYDDFEVNRGAASLIKPSNPTNSYDVCEETFSNYFNSDTKIDLIKIDIEGYELNMLKGAKGFLTNSKNPPILIVEFSSTMENSQGRDLKPLATFIQNMNGYRLFKPILGKERVSKLIEINRFEDLPKHDNVFCFTDQHIKKIDNEIFL